MEITAFIILSVLALVSACVVVFHRSPVISALALVMNLVAVAGFYLLLNAQILALLQVIVYAGAIMVLVLFVVMLLNLQDEERVRGSGFFQKWLGLALAIGFAWIVGRAYLGSTAGRVFPDPSPEFGTVSALGLALFDRFFYAFEVISLLLVVAMIGAVMLAKRRL
jgi:NADH-quinone oxidoreductase subunit J